MLWRNQATGEDAVRFMNGSRRSGLAFLPRVIDPNWIIWGPR
jgi:hypothetical protein